MARPKSSKTGALTEAELQVMNILWKNGVGTVHEVRDQLMQDERGEYAYTTISTLLRVLEKKGAVRSEKVGRGHRYLPKIEREGYQKRATQQLLENVYGGRASDLVKTLLGGEVLTESELAEVRKILEEAE